MGLWIGFGIWSTVSLLFVVLGVNALRSREPVGFYANIRPPKVRDAKAYNQAVSKLFFASAALMEALGLPLLLGEGHPAVLIVSILGPMFVSIGMVVAYMRIEGRHKM